MQDLEGMTRAYEQAVDAERAAWAQVAKSHRDVDALQSWLLRADLVLNLAKSLKELAYRRTH